MTQRFVSDKGQGFALLFDEDQPRDSRWDVEGEPADSQESEVHTLCLHLNILSREREIATLEAARALVSHNLECRLYHLIPAPD